MIPCWTASSKGPATASEKRGRLGSFSNWMFTFDNLTICEILSICEILCLRICHSGIITNKRQDCALVFQINDLVCAFRGIFKKWLKLWGQLYLNQLAFKYVLTSTQHKLQLEAA